MRDVKKVKFGRAWRHSLIVITPRSTHTLSVRTLSMDQIDLLKIF